MNFQQALLRRRGRFGTIWLAAHHPAKISKTEIIRMNISRKCDEIIEYIINGRENRPKFSLVISSHLMLGLCVLVKKQSQFLLDDLMHLRQEIHKCFINEKLVFKAPKEATKRTPVKTPKKLEKSAITLKENLPLLSTNLDTYYEQENERLGCLIEETIERLLIPKHLPAISMIEENLDPISAFQTEDFQFDSGMLLVPENLQDTFFNAENLEKTKVTSTAKFDRIQSRIPFKELSTNEQVRRAELTTTIANDQEPDIYADLESLLTKRPDHNEENIPPRAPLQIPELYQESFVEPLVPAALVEETTQAQTEQAIAPDVEVSGEVAAHILPVRRIKKDKKQGLLIDEKTEISGHELSKRVRRDAQEKNLDELFAKNRLEMKLNFDFLKKDLLKETSSLMMRATSRTYSCRDSVQFVKNILMRPNLKSAKFADDQLDYTTQARQQESLLNTEVEEGRKMGESLERGRKRQSTSKVDGESMRISSKIVKTKEAEVESRILFEESNTVQFQEQAQDQIHLEVHPLIHPMEPPLISVRAPSLERALDVDDYEHILRDEIRKREQDVQMPILQDVIREMDLVGLSVSSRRKFGIKLFERVLTMCKDKSLKAEQAETYGDIKLKLVLSV